MHKELHFACEYLTKGQSVVLCVILSGSGSAPRGKGAYMFVSPDGTIAGTIGGGAVEQAAITEAARVHQSSEGCIQHYRLHQNQAADLGMICGGSVDVLFHKLTSEDLPVVKSAMRDQHKAWLWFLLENDKAVQLGYADTCHFPKEMPPSLFCREAVWMDGFPAMFAFPVTYGEQVLIFGGGHVSQALTPILTTVGFSCTILDDREDFTNPALFPPEAETVLCDFHQLCCMTQVSAEDYLVVLTRGHQWDYLVLKSALRTSAGYIGCIGSRTKVAATRQRLLEDGFTPKDLERMHSPIGIAIGAVTPAEIAVSIAAEMIAHRHTKAAANL